MAYPTKRSGAPSKRKSSKSPKPRALPSAKPPISKIRACLIESLHRAIVRNGNENSPVVSVLHSAAQRGPDTSAPDAITKSALSIWKRMPIAKRKQLCGGWDFDFDSIPTAHSSDGTVGPAIRLTISPQFASFYHRPPTHISTRIEVADPNRTSVEVSIGFGTTKLEAIQQIMLITESIDANWERMIASPQFETVPTVARTAAAAAAA